MFRKIICSLFIAITCSIVQANEESTYVSALNEVLISEQSVNNLKDPVHVQDMVLDFYSLRQNKPAWTNSHQIEQVLSELQASFGEGLSPDDYHYSTLLRLYTNSQQLSAMSNNDKVQFELLLTDGVLLYALHLIHGKVDPSDFDATWNYKRRKLLPEELIARLEKHIEDGTVAQALDNLKPKVDIYNQIKEGLVLYRQIQSENPFTVIEPTILLKPGEQSDVIPALRERLIAMKLLDVNAGESDIYDSQLFDAVELFQLQHGLDNDGVIGKKTWQALNISWQDRIDDIRINLERTRWVYENASDNFVIVNIAGFRLYLVRNKKVEWETPVMTGTVATQTPLFMSRFSYMELNPTWTVPRSILRASLINKMKNDPDYIAAHDFLLLDRNNEKVDTQTLDWDKLNTNNFPYTVVQQPGVLNALGQIKFIFPNEHAIYLHDTPSKSLFSRSARAFSHGCVRVKEPLEFAKRLMNSPIEWPKEKFTDILESKKRTRISVEAPTDVLLMYWTTEPFAQGNIKFNPDIYNRNPRVLASLNKKAY